MTRRRRLNLTENEADIRYQNWTAQVLSVIMPWSLYWIAGRASAKTVQVLAERVQEAAQDCPGAPFAWVADTYSDLHRNVIPSLIDGLALIGWEEGTHYIINKCPPEEWKRRMYNRTADWRNTMVFFTGFNFTFISLDRMAIGAGRSFVGVFGDEVKYFPEDRFTNLLKAVRGFYARYGESVWYRSRTLTTDMPNPNRLGEYDWILKMSAQNDKRRILLCLQAGMVYNETKKTYVAHLSEYNRTRQNKEESAIQEPEIQRMERRMELARRNMKRWEERWIKTRRGLSLFFISSSYVNVDVLGTDWFADEIGEGLEGLACNVLSVIPKLEASSLFYPNLSVRHFYADGYRNEVIERHPLGWEEDCTALRHIDGDAVLEAGMDAGNMLSMVVGQRKGHVYRVLKELYTLPPETVRDLGRRFVSYFAPARVKRLKLYFDRSMNAYSKVGNDMATQIKRSIELDAEGRRTGWTVQLMSLGQGNIGSNLEYRFFSDLLAGNLERQLFVLMMDRHNCQNLKSEMEVTRTKTVRTSSGSEMVVKQKTGDKLSRERLPKESTNLTDALKYLLMRKDFLRVWQARPGIDL